MHRLLGSASDGRKKWCASMIQDFISPVHMTAVVASTASRSTRSGSIRFTAFTTSRVRNAKEITKLRFWCSRIGTNPPPPNHPYLAIQISTSSKTSFFFFSSFGCWIAPARIVVIVTCNGFVLSLKITTTHSRMVDPVSYTPEGH